MLLFRARDKADSRGWTSRRWRDGSRRRSFGNREEKPARVGVRLGGHAGERGEHRLGHRREPPIPAKRSLGQARVHEKQRNAALANYQAAVQTAFRDVSDALARRATMDEQLSAARGQQAAASDNYLLTEARYRAGIDPFLNVLVAQRAYYTAQNTLVQTKATAGHNRVDLYQALGGDPLIAGAPPCAVNYVSNGGNATLVTDCTKAS